MLGFGSCRKLIKLLILLVPFFSYAQTEMPVSAARGENQTWQEALEEQGQFRGVKFELPEASEVYSTVAIPKWEYGIDELNKLTVEARVIRNYQNPNPGNFKRRAPWYFPVDGCYAKAAHVSAFAKSQKFVKPGKVFAYGDLELRSPYSKNRQTTFWSYHVAAAYQIDQIVYVMDPTVNPIRALTVSEWVSQISKKPREVKVKLCDHAAYSPYSRCQGGNGNGAYLGHIQEVLRLEWNHLASIGYSPQEVLSR